MNQSRKIRVNVDKLAATMKDNLTAHAAAYKVACAEYRAACMVALTRTLEKAQACHDEEKGFVSMLDILNLSQPRSYAQEYSEVIAMLEFQEDTELELDPDEFNRWVLDQWDWKRNFAAAALSNTQYLGGHK